MREQGLTGDASGRGELLGPVAVEVEDVGVVGDEATAGGGDIGLDVIVVHTVEGVLHKSVVVANGARAGVADAGSDVLAAKTGLREAGVVDEGADLARLVVHGDGSRADLLQRHELRAHVRLVTVRVAVVCGIKGMIADEVVAVANVEEARGGLGTTSNRGSSRRSSSNSGSLLLELHSVGVRRSMIARICGDIGRTSLRGGSVRASRRRVGIRRHGKGASAQERGRGGRGTSWKEKEKVKRKKTKLRRR